MSYFEEKVRRMINNDIESEKRDCENAKKKMDNAQRTLTEYTNEYNKHKREIEKLERYLIDYNTKVMKMDSIEEDKERTTIKEMIKNKLQSFDKYTEFENITGINCRDECKGWNGRSNRCDCGRNRVDWVYNSDKDIVFAEAW